MNLRERNNNIKEFFNDKVDEYDLEHQKFMSSKKEISKYLDIDSSRILDLGVGSGLELNYVFERFPDIKVCAVDISDKMLDKLKERSYSKNIDIICGDFFNIEYGYDYDAVISSSALHHFIKEDKMVLYKKIYDSLKDKGLFINVDKVAKDIDEENDFIEYYNNNKDKVRHIDTPLCIDNELDILNKIGYKNINIKDVDALNYKIIVARK